MIRKSLAIALAIAPCLALAEAPAVPPAAPAAQPTGNWQFALRGAYALPYGSSTSARGDDLSAVVSGDLPLAVEVNYRLSDAWYLGGTFQYGFASLSNQLSQLCTGGSCSAHTMRLAFNVLYHLGAPRTFHGWLGAGVGYEELGMDAKGSGGSSSMKMSGGEISFQGGLDYPLSSAVAIGPFLGASFSQFTHGEVRTPSQSRSGEISNTAAHGWFTLGLRMSFGP